MKQKIADESEDEIFDKKRKPQHDNVGRNKRVKINGVEGKQETVEWDEMGVREQKQLLKDQIVDMIVKAGWTIEYRERKSKPEYKDAVYIDREGRGYWSVTLAYNKLKERIDDEGECTVTDIAAFTPIPDDKLGVLLRSTTPGMKKRAAGKIDNKVRKKVMSKVSLVDGESSSRTRKGLMGVNSVGKSNKTDTRKVDGKASSRTRQTLRGHRVGDESDDDGYDKRDVAASTPIPDEKLGVLLKSSALGLNKRAAEKTDNKVMKKVMSKVSLVDGESSSRTRKGLMGVNSVEKSNKNVTRKVDGKASSRTRHTLRGRSVGDESDDDGYELCNRDIAASTPIPDEKLGVSLRSSTLGLNKRAAEKTDNKVTKKVMSKVSLVDEGSCLRTRKNLMGGNSVGKGNKNDTRKVDGKASSRTRQTLRGRSVGDESDDDGYELYKRNIAASTPIPDEKLGVLLRSSTLGLNKRAAEKTDNKVMKKVMSKVSLVDGGSSLRTRENLMGVNSVGKGNQNVTRKVDGKACSRTRPTLRGRSVGDESDDDGYELYKRDIAASTPIPDEKLGVLLRSSTLGLNKKAAGKIDNKVMKKVMSKVSLVDGGRSLRTRKNLMGVNSARKNSKNLTRKVNGKDNSRTRQTLRGRRVGDESDEDGYELYEGKRSLLSWLIDMGTVHLGGKVRYRKERTDHVLLYGKIVNDGICCDCCNTTHTVQGFESHGNSDLRNPYQNTYLESGKSLFQCIVDSWNKHVEVESTGSVQVDVECTDDPNDDRCNICCDGGNLICCDKCPSAFHKKCLNIDIPSGDWQCVYCLCKFCGIADEISSISDDIQDLSALFTCRFCEDKFHINCAKEKAAIGFHPSGQQQILGKQYFCGIDCQKIFLQLQILLGVRSVIDEGFSHTILQHRKIWSAGNGEIKQVITNAKLAVAFSVMDECFVPSVDELSGNNMIHSVVYNRWSNIRRLNYGGFYTIILEKDDEIVAVASIRIHGSRLAEMPFIGTRHAYRRQGMCSRLLTVVEKFLKSLGVEKLVIPAIDELHETWTKVFGFQPVEKPTSQEMKHLCLIVFPKTNMLQKTLGSIKTITSSDIMMVQ